MDDYNRYVTAVNKIFDYLEKMKAGWNNTDNKNYIDTIDEFKGVVTSRANEFKKPPTVKLEKTSAELDEEQERAIKEEREKRKQALKDDYASEEKPPEPKQEEAIPEMPVQEIPSSFSAPTPGIPSTEELVE